MLVLICWNPLTMASVESKSDSSLKDKVILITGASSGIGAGAAKYLSTLGSHLSLVGRNADNLNEVQDSCIKNGLIKEKTLIVVADLSEESDCKKAVEKTFQFFGRIDVLINSAGILVPGSIETLSVEDYDRQMNINCRSLFIMIQLCVPHLIETKGNIVNVSSVTGLRAFPGVLAYNMSKAAVDQLTRTVALELGEKGVRCNAVNPGVIMTDVHKRAGMNEEQYLQFLEHSKTTHALGRVGTADEVAQAIVFLAADSASFITGVTLPIDGGRSIMCPR